MDIKFPQFPIIYMWIESDYNKCENLEGYINFMSNCFEVSNEIQNKVKKEAYYNTACVVYSKLTGRSWESIDDNY